MRHNLHIVGIIPARMGSSPLAGNPLRKIAGISMLGHCYFRSAMSETLDAVYIATCDQEIADYAHTIGATAIMTNDSHQRASDCTAEALIKIEHMTGRPVDIVVMILGDELMLRPEMIDEALKPMIEDASVRVVNLMAPLKTGEEHDDINEVKVVVDRHNNALYFSREAIPSRRQGGEGVTKLKQVCIMPFRRDFLIEFIALEPTPLEIAESVDMNRVLEHGYDVRMVHTQFNVHSVGTEDDLLKVEALMSDDDLIANYRGV